MSTLSTMSIQQKRELLMSVLAKGKFAKIKWVKKDGSIAERTIKLWMEHILASGNRNIVQDNPAEHVVKMFSAADVTNDKWVNIDVTNLLEVKSGSTIYN
jgi:hypothetical protein